MIKVQKADRGETCWFEETPLEFVECPACAAKPGSPALCSSCLQNRSVIGRLQAKLNEPDPECVQMTMRHDLSVMVDMWRSSVTVADIWKMSKSMSAAKIAEITGSDAQNIDKIVNDPANGVYLRGASDDSR